MDKNRVSDTQPEVQLLRCPRMSPIAPILHRLIRAVAKRRARRLLAEARRTLESVMDLGFDEELSCLVDETIETEEQVAS